MTDDPQLKDRIQVFRNMLNADPDNELALFSLGKLNLQAGDLAESEKALRRVLEINARHSMSYRLLGQVLVETDRKDEAITLLEEGVQIAHGKGEFQPRNQMQDLLRELGVDPPEPVTESGGGAAGSGEWVCLRCGLPNERLEKPPLQNELGKQAHESICQSCWREWIGMSIKVINEYRLNLASDEGSRVYETHMQEFLGLSGSSE
jgi:Fe-S cluster biosynthesis and repair protein YggX